MSVTDHENKLETLREDYFRATEEFIKKSLLSDIESPQDEMMRFHKSATTFFNFFERTLDEEGLPENIINSETATRKVEDTINIVTPIISHWEIIKTFCVKFNLSCPEPSETAYASIQRVIKSYKPEKAQEIRTKFVNAKLPTYGFDDKALHKSWKDLGKRKLLIFTIGFSCLLIILLFLLPYLNKVGHLSEVGLVIVNIIYTILSIVCALVLFGYLRSTGLVRTTKYSFGGAAAFVIVFLNLFIWINKTKTDYQIQGNVYQNGKPLDNAEISAIQIQKSGRTNSFGFFSFKLFQDELLDSLDFTIKSKEIDTLITYGKDEYLNMLKIEIKNNNTPPDSLNNHEKKESSTSSEDSLKPPENNDTIVEIKSDTIQLWIKSNLIKQYSIGVDDISIDHKMATIINWDHGNENESDIISILVNYGSHLFSVKNMKEERKNIDGRISKIFIKQK